MVDLLIAGGTVVDGTGSAPLAGWVAIDDGEITAVGRHGAVAPQAAHTLTATGLVVAPGFVDVHNHSDLSPFVLPSMPSTLRQGVTTVVVGNCGSSPWPLAGWDEAVVLAYGDPAAQSAPGWQGWADYLDAIDRAEPAVNIATLVGHGSIRLEVLGHERRPPTATELDRMRAFVRDAIDDGAVGMSTGLIYVPGIFATTDEVVSLAGAAAEAGGLYASHIRGEGRDLVPAITEALTIADRAGLPVHVSHLKCESARVWGRAHAIAAMIHDAPDATADQYPYPAWNSSLSSLLPPWAPVEGLAEITGRDRIRLRTAVEVGEPDFQSSVDGVGWDRIVLVSAPEPAWRGRTVAEVAEVIDLDPFDAFLELLERDPSISCIGHAMDEGDVRAFLADPAVFVASDASATAPDGPGGDLPVHPREYGTFPRALRLARDDRLLPLEAIIRKMTSLPAERFGLRDRGRLVPGSAADVVVLDPSTVSDTATFERPHVFAEGIAHVVVNGTVAWSSDGPTITRAGRAVRR